MWLQLWSRQSLGVDVPCHYISAFMSFVMVTSSFKWQLALFVIVVVVTNDDAGKRKEEEERQRHDNNEAQTVTNAWRWWSNNDGDLEKGVSIQIWGRKYMLWKVHYKDVKVRLIWWLKVVVHQRSLTFMICARRRL